MARVAMRRRGTRQSRRSAPSSDCDESTLETDDDTASDMGERDDSVGEVGSRRPRRKIRDPGNAAAKVHDKKESGEDLVTERYQHAPRRRPRTSDKSVAKKHKVKAGDNGVDERDSHRSRRRRRLSADTDERQAQDSSDEVRHEKNPRRSHRMTRASDGDGDRSDDDVRSDELADLKDSHHSSRSNGDDLVRQKTSRRSIRKQLDSDEDEDADEKCIEEEASEGSRNQKSPPRSHRTPCSSDNDAEREHEEDSPRDSDDSLAIHARLNALRRPCALDQHDVKTSDDDHDRENRSGRSLRRPRDLEHHAGDDCNEEAKEDAVCEKRARKCKRKTHGSSPDLDARRDDLSKGRVHEGSARQSRRKTHGSQDDNPKECEAATASSSKVVPQLVEPPVKRFREGPPKAVPKSDPRKNDLHDRPPLTGNSGKQQQPDAADSEDDLNPEEMDKICAQLIGEYSSFDDGTYDVFDDPIETTNDVQEAFKSRMSDLAVKQSERKTTKTAEPRTKPQTSSRPSGFDARKYKAPGRPIAEETRSLSPRRDRVKVDAAPQQIAPTALPSSSQQATIPSAWHRPSGPCTGAAASRSFAHKNAAVPGIFGGQQGCCIFVGHLPPGTTEMAFVQHFQQFGPIVAVKMFPYESYCLCQYTCPADAELAVNMMNRRVWFGASLNCKKSHHTFVR